MLTALARNATKRTMQARIAHLLGVGLVVTVTGCASRTTIAPAGVGDAWEQRAVAGRRLESDTGPASPQDRAHAGDGASRARTEPIATVNGRAMQRHRIVDLLLRANGVGVLEQLVVLDAAAELATHKGLTITQADIDREYDAALRKLVDPFSGASSGNFDREAAERTLESVLAQRHISREEFRLGMRRHADLRRIGESELTFTREQLQAELQRRYGPRLEVRHIQLASPRSAARIRARLANGEDFAQLAREHSANLISAEAGGLLQPFSDKDDALPALFRQTASSLKAGEVSEAGRGGGWCRVGRPAAAAGRRRAVRDAPSPGPWHTSSS